VTQTEGPDARSAETERRANAAEAVASGTSPGSAEEGEVLPGVRAFEHTADIGIEVHAASLDTLFERAAAGMFSMIGTETEGTYPARSEADGAGHPAARVDAGEAGARPGAITARRLDLRASDAPALLVSWLRELLYLYDSECLAFESAEFFELTDRSLRADVRLTPSSGALREIKAVTYHGLAVTRTDSGWRARVLFDI
jgi:SHS2 domain-containing protein